MWNKEHGISEQTDTDMLLETFKKYNINLVGKTDILVKLIDHNKWDRIGQINRYVEKNLTKDDKFIILDDEDVISEGSIVYRHLSYHFVQTEAFGNGFDEIIYKKAKKLFTN